MWGYEADGNVSVGVRGVGVRGVVVVSAGHVGGTLGCV